MLAYIDYIPEFLRDFRELQALGLAADAMAAAARARVEEVCSGQCIQSAPPEILARHEALFCIRADPLAETIQYRRRRILSLYGTTPPFTLLWLQERLASIYPDQEFSLELDGATYRLIVKAAFNTAGVAGSVVDLLRRVMPANIVFSLVKKDRTHDRLSMQTHDELAAYQQGELAGEILPGQETL